MVKFTYLGFALAIGWMGDGPAYALDSYRVNAGAQASINEHSVCYTVVNSSAFDYFVPTKTAAEWTAFRNNLPADVALCDCASTSTAGFNGNCWYMGTAGQSCTTVCSTHGGYHTATRDFAGSNGTNANCTTLLNHFGYNGTVATNANARGCSVRNKVIDTRRRGTNPTDPDAVDANYDRACACNQ